MQNYAMLSIGQNATLTAGSKLSARFGFAVFQFGSDLKRTLTGINLTMSSALNFVFENAGRLDASSLTMNTAPGAVSVFIHR